MELMQSKLSNQITKGSYFRKEFPEKGGNRAYGSIYIDEFNYLVIGYANGQVIIYDPKNLESQVIQLRLDRSFIILSMAYNAHLKILLLFCLYGDFFIMSVPSFNILSHILLPTLCANYLTETLPNVYAMGDQDSKILFFDVLSNKILFRFSEISQTKYIEYSKTEFIKHENALVVSCKTTGELKVFLLESRREVFSKKAHGKDHICCLSYNKETNKLISGGYDETVVVWEVERGGQLKMLYQIEKMGNWITGLLVFPEEDAFVCLGFKNEVYKYRLKDGKLIDSQPADQEISFEHQNTGLTHIFGTDFIVAGDFQFKVLNFINYKTYFGIRQE
jgi:WD40 repeat protein